MRILVIDDHPLFQDAMELSLRREWPDADILIVSSLDDPRLGDPATVGRPFNLVVLDWFMPGTEETDPLTQIQALGVKGPVAVITGAEQPGIARDALRCGAAAFVPKTIARQVMVLALRLVVEGGSFVPVPIALAMTAEDDDLAPRHDDEADAGDDGGPAPLTDREREVLGMLYTGATNKEIARHLNLAEVTVKLHTRRILRKLGARNRTDAVRKAQEAGILSPHHPPPGTG